MMHEYIAEKLTAQRAEEAERHWARERDALRDTVQRMYLAEKPLAYDPALLDRYLWWEGLFAGGETAQAGRAPTAKGWLARLARRHRGGFDADCAPA